MIAQVTTETVQELTFDGPLSLSTVVAGGTALACVVILILWLERQVIGRFWMVFFALLRGAALVAACWMLLQPSRVERQSTVLTRSVAIVADRSGSMDTVDNQLTPQMLPWVDLRDSQTALAERATIDLRVAARLIRTHWLESASLGKQARDEVLQRFDTATSRGKEHLQHLAAATKASDQVVSDRVVSVLDELEVTVLDRRELDRSDEGDEQQVNRFADRMVESLQQQIADLDAVVRKLSQDRIQANPAFESKPRREFVSDWLNQLETQTLNEITSKAKIKRATFDQDVQSFAGNDWKKQLGGETAAGSQTSPNQPLPGTRTNLTAAVSWFGPTSVTDRLAAIFLVSEGGHNANTKLTPVSAGRALGGVPIIGVGIGNASRSRDLVLHQVNAPRVVAEDDDIKIEAIISAYDCEGDDVKVTLNQGDQEIDSKQVRVDSALSDTRLQFRVPAGEVGLREFQLAIEPLDREVSEKNNYSAFSVETIRGKTRVLLADYQTRWEYRYLQILFARDKRVESDEYLEEPRLHRTGQIAALGGLPETVEQWAHYDVVILGDVNLTSASRTSLQEYVLQRGGRLIVVAGEHHMPAAYVGDSLFDILPVQPQFSAQLPHEPFIAISQEGAMHPAMQIEAAPSESRERWTLASSRTSVGFVSPWSIPKDSARVLATLRDRDATVDESAAGQTRETAWLCWHRSGSGRVVYASAPATFKLRFRGGDLYHHRFWGQMLRWCMSSDLASDEQLVHLRTDKSNYIQGDTVQIVAQLRNTQGFPEVGGEVSVTITPTEGEPRTLTLDEDEHLPGTYRVDVRELEPDVYQLKPSGRTVERLQTERPEGAPSQAIITVEQVGDIEHMVTSANYPLMAEIASATGGELVTPAAAEELFSLLPLKEEVKTVEQRTPIWNRWPMLFLVAGCLSTEWFIRKMKGLI